MQCIISFPSSFLCCGSILPDRFSYSTVGVLTALRQSVALRYMHDDVRVWKRRIAHTTWFCMQRECQRQNDETRVETDAVVRVKQKREKKLGNKKSKYNKIRKIRIRASVMEIEMERRTHGCNGAPNRKQRRENRKKKTENMNRAKW